MLRRLGPRRRSRINSTGSLSPEITAGACRHFDGAGLSGGTENARLENGGLENAAPNCRTGKRKKRHAWKAKRCTSHVVFNRISATDERVPQCHSKSSITAMQAATHK